MKSSLYYIIGASGSGKDTLLQALERRFQKPEYVFIKRYITRLPMACKNDSGENSLNIDESAKKEGYLYISKEDFIAKEKSNAFAMTWRSYDTYYGIPSSIDNDLEAGKKIFINGSREYLPTALKLYPNLQIVLLEADEKTLERRLLARGRDKGDELKKRIKNAKMEIDFLGENCIRLNSSGEIEDLLEECIEKLALS